MQYYLVIASERKHAALFSREDGEWIWRGFGANATIALPNIDLVLDLAAVYVGWEREREIDLGG